MFSLWTAASEETGEDLDKDDEADEEDDQDEADHVQQVVLRPGQVKGGRSGEGYDDDDDDIYIMMSICLCVTKNHHFLLGVSCTPPGCFFMVLGRFYGFSWF